LIDWETAMQTITTLEPGNGDCSMVCSALTDLPYSLQVYIYT